MDKETIIPAEIAKTATGGVLPEPSKALPENDTDKDDLASREKKTSKGEKIYNWAVYSGLNYWLNLAISIVSTDYFINLKGRKYLNQWADGLAHGIAATKTMTFDKAHHHSKTALETFMVLSGGNALLVPLKLMEDRKRPIVHWINEKLGVDQTAPDGHKMTPNEIYIDQEQPHQSWPRVLVRRVTGWVAVVATGHAINGVFRDRSKPLPLKGEPDTYGGKSVVTNFVMGHANKAFNSGYVPGGKFLATHPRAQALMGFVVLDSIFTEITAVIMRVTNGAKHLKKKKALEEAAAAQESAAVASNNTLTDNTPAESMEGDREKYKAKKILPTTNYTELAKQDNTGLALTH